jgi:hypothetical protein
MNKKFRMEVATNLMVPDYATNRGGPATLEWSNIYWYEIFTIFQFFIKKLLKIFLGMFIIYTYIYIYIYMLSIYIFIYIYIYMYI